VWYAQTLDAVLAVAGLVTIGFMLHRWEFPWGAILLAAFCVGGLSAGQLIDAVTGRWSKREDGS
jgi:hypothetical protein